jgi:hypothetical protein
MSTPEQDKYLQEHFNVDLAKHRAAAASGGAVSVASPTGGGFVPDLEIPSAPKLVIDVNETVILKLKISNWNRAPKGIKVSWGESTSGDAVDIESEHHDGEGSVKVTGLVAGEGTVRAEVKIGEGDAGRSYRFADTVFAVRGVPASAFVPDLEIPSAPRLLLGVGQSVPLKFKIRNWGALPKGTGIEWRLSANGDAVKLTDDSKGGEATVTVTAANTGEATVKAEVRIGSGGAPSYRFADTVFVVKEASQVVDPDNPDPDSSPDQGGIASVTDLEQDMRTFLVEWKTAATDGVTEFITSALNQRINDLASGSTKNFLLSLLGNMIWAAACFASGGTAFAISVVGVGIGAIPSVPSKVDETFIPDIQKAMIGQIDAIFDHENTALRTKAQALLKSEPGITRFHALALFVEASFQYKYISVDATFTTIPKLNAGAMTATYAALAKQELDKAIAADKKRKQEIEDKRTMDYWKTHSRRQPGEV